MRRRVAVPGIGTGDGGRVPVLKVRVLVGQEALQKVKGLGEALVCASRLLEDLAVSLHRVGHVLLLGHLLEVQELLGLVRRCPGPRLGRSCGSATSVLAAGEVQEVTHALFAHEVFREQVGGVFFAAHFVELDAASSYGLLYP